MLQAGSAVRSDHAEVLEYLRMVQKRWREKKTKSEVVVKKGAIPQFNCLK